MSCRFWLFVTLLALVIYGALAQPTRPLYSDLRGIPAGGTTSGGCGTMACGTGIVTFDVTVARPVAGQPLTSSDPCMLGEVRFSSDKGTCFLCVDPSGQIKWRKFSLSAF